MGPIRVAPKTKSMPQGPPIVAVEHEMKTLHDHLLAQIQRDANGWTKAQQKTFAKELQRLMDKVAAFGEEKEEAAATVAEATTAAPAAADAVAKEEKTATAVVPAVTSEFDEELLKAAKKGEASRKVEALLAKGRSHTAPKAVDKEHGWTPCGDARRSSTRWRHRDGRRAARTRRGCEGGGQG